ncbi:hypothetical protein GCM10025868_28340 [Angustibacter aerolatus]|uniref:GGDEF domain-containing protein n=1 Tax=Angustibacter aerolatus TaxID=1162965 RepID=A0ABQ6JIB8_9ACTN|nr:hypothetical protein GCM10025868_28340 [Angustibacter aerolatus]
MLVAFGSVLRDSVRGSDLVARYGGEEFVLVVRTDAEGLGAVAVLERLRVRWSFVEPGITWSAGAAVHLEGVRPQDTVQEADRALYEAKATGRDRVVAATPSPSLAGLATASSR